MADTGGQQPAIIVASIVLGVVVLLFAVGMGIGTGFVPESAGARESRPVDVTNAADQQVMSTLSLNINSCEALRANRQAIDALNASVSPGGEMAVYIKKQTESNTLAADKKQGLLDSLEKAQKAMLTIITKADDCVSGTASANTEIVTAWNAVKLSVTSLRNSIVAGLGGKYYFPGVEQGKNQYCQQASAVMVALTYISNYGANPVTQFNANTLPEALQKAVGANGSSSEAPRTWSKYGNNETAIKEAVANRAPVAWFTTPRTGTFCSVHIASAAPRLLNAIGDPVPNDWVAVSPTTDLGIVPGLVLTNDNRAKVYQAMVASLSKDPPDPVVADFTNGAACSYTHIIPLFMKAGSAFITNNPGPGKIQYNTTKCGRKELSEANVSRFARVVIRKPYLQAVGLLP
jgi:hypothetical protein